MGEYDGSVNIAVHGDIEPIKKDLKEAEKKVHETAENITKKTEAYAKKNEEALKKSLYALEVEAKAKGKAVSEQARYNVYLKSYTDLLTKTNGVIKEGHPLAQKRLEQLTKMRLELEKTHKTQKNVTEVLKTAAGAALPYAAAAAAAGAAVKKAGEAVRECSEYYKVQEKAERALATAAQNNPYIDGQAVAALKDFASELQSASNIGDELSISLMTPLVAAGRTREQIQAIMQASADIAASGTISMDAAVKNLNKTFAGLAGELGETIPEIKNLTKEQLENGEAVGIIQEKYKGMAKNLADTRIQAENAKGDFKEIAGALAAPAVDAWDRFWKGFWENAAKAAQWIKNNRDIASSSSFLDSMIEKATGKKKEQPAKGRGAWHFGEVAKKGGRGLTKAPDKPIEVPQAVFESKLYTASTEELERVISLLEKKKKLSQDEQELQKQALALLEKRRNEEKALAEQNARQDALKKAQEEADAYAQESNKALKEKLHLLELEAKAKGEAVDVQDIYNVYLQSYIDLLGKSNGVIKENYPIAQKRLSQLEAAKRAVDEQTEAEKKLKAAIEATQALIKSIKDIEKSSVSANPLQKNIEAYKKIKSDLEKMSDEQVRKAQEGNETVYSKKELLETLEKGEAVLEGKTIQDFTDSHAQKNYIDQYKSQQEELLAFKRSIDESEVLSEEQKAQAKQMIDERYAANKLELAKTVLSEIKNYTQQAAQVAQDAGNLMLQYVQNQHKLEMESINERYEKGEIAEEEYEKKRTDIKRKTAQKEYRIRMFQWTASMMAAVANVAEGVSKALSLGFPLGLISGPLVAAAGGVQIASIMASKPSPPSFATGGIVGGTSYYGDHVPAFVNSGEMITNFPQQKRLWAMLNGQERYKPSFPVTINNTQSNRVNAEVREQNGSLFVDILDKHINKGLTDGTYDAGFSGMHAREQGVSIL